MNPAAIFPPELWEAIFEHLGGSHDWLNLYRASPFFKDLVGGKRVVALFPQIFPQVFEYLVDLDEILRLRLVSRQWKECVDKLLEADNAVMGMELKRRKMYTFENPATITSFLDKFEATPAGVPAMIGRRITLDYRDSLDDKRRLVEYTDSVSRLLHRFGPQLRSLEILDRTDHWLNSVDEFLERLRNVVRETPALDSLSIQVSTLFSSENNVEVGRLADTLGLPLIPNLRSLSFNRLTIGLGLMPWGENRCKIDLQEAIAQICVNPASLKKLDIVGLPCAFLDFPNLESATLQIFGAEDCSRLVANCLYPLTSLDLTSFSNSVDIRGLLRCAEHFKETLTSLVLHAAYEGDHLESQFMADLPHLKYLQLPQLISFHVLGSLKCLEVLKVRGPVRRFSRAFEEQVERSRIFDELPKLIKVEMSWSGNERFPLATPVRKCYFRDRQIEQNRKLGSGRQLAVLDRMR